MLSNSMGPQRPFPKLMFIAVFIIGLITGYLYAFWERQHAPFLGQKHMHCTPLRREDRGDSTTHAPWEWFGALQTQMVPQQATMPHGAPPTLAASPMSALLLALGVRLNRSRSITG